MNFPRLQRISMRTLLYIGAAVLALQAAFPFLWMVSTSLKPPPEVFATPPAFIPDEPTLENFIRLFSATHFLTYFKNSIVVCGWAVVLTMIVSAFGAYSLTRYPLSWTGKDRGTDFVHLHVRPHHGGHPFFHPG